MLCVCVCIQHQAGGHLIASFDPFGHIVTEAWPEYFQRGYDIRPTIAGKQEGR